MWHSYTHFDRLTIVCFSTSKLDVLIKTINKKAIGPMAQLSAV